jgi:hypothetical protein
MHVKVAIMENRMFSWTKYPFQQTRHCLWQSGKGKGDTWDTYEYNTKWLNQDGWNIGIPLLHVKCIPAKLLFRKNRQTEFIDIVTDSITSTSIFSSRLHEAKVRGWRQGRCTYTRMTYNYHCSNNFNQFRDMTAIHTTHKKIPILFGP